MPKATKLHAKGKSTTIQKPCKVEKDGPDSVNPEESIRQFQLELCWCVQQLEKSLNEKKGNEKQLQELWKVLTVLKNNNQPIIRKRQLMRTHFGDYRAKMAAEEKKLVKMARKIKISDVPDKPKATFFRKSAFLTTGDSSFTFNFNPPSDEIDNANSLNLDKDVASNCNTAPEKPRSITEISNDGNVEHKIDLHNSTDDTSSENMGKDETKNFKFSFTSSEFKFNFDVQK